MSPSIVSGMCICWYPKRNEIQPFGTKFNPPSVDRREKRNIFFLFFFPRISTGPIKGPGDTYFFIFFAKGKENSVLDFSRGYCVLQIKKKIPGKNQKQNLDSSSRVVSLHKTFTYFIVENAVNQMACTLSSSGLVPLKLSHVRHSCVRTMKVRYCRVIIGLKTKNNFSPVL